MLMPQLLSPPLGHKDGIAPGILSLTLKKVKRVQSLHKLHSSHTQIPKEEQISSGIDRISPSVLPGSKYHQLHHFS